MSIEWTIEQGRISSRGEHDELIAEATFCERENGVFDINHTFVVPRLRGRGVAGQMMSAIAALIREKKGKVTASCPYAHAWLKKHEKEYADIVSSDLNDQAPACRLDDTK